MSLYCQSENHKQRQWRNPSVFDDRGALEIPWSSSEAGVGVCLTACLRWRPWALQRPSLLYALSRWAQSRKAVVTSHNDVKILLHVVERKNTTTFFPPLKIVRQNKGENAAFCRVKNFPKVNLTLFYVSDVDFSYDWLSHPVAGFF